MKAQILKNPGTIEYCDTMTPTVKSRECLIKVAASGICGSDISRIYKTGAHVHPIVPGHEFSGTVFDANGSKIVSDGDRVGVFPLIPCMKCEQCKKKQYEMCKNYSYLGSRCDGGFAEYVAVPEWNLIKLPNEVSFSEAAMLEPLSVAIHAVRKAVQGKTTDCFVAVYGLGTIGLMVSYVLKSLGYENIIGIGNKDFQKKSFEELGTGHYVDSRKNSVNTDVKAITEDKGMDVIFECIGKSDTYEASINLASAGGNVMLVGNPFSDMKLEKNIYWKILRNQLTVFGTWNSSFTNEEDDDWHLALKLISERKIDLKKLITHSFPLSELQKGLEIMRDKSEDYIKIMCIF